MTIFNVYYIIKIMNHTFHCHLRKSFQWYNKWHNHPRHQHTHWLAFLVVIFSTFSFISGQTDLFPYYSPTIQEARAQSVPNYAESLKNAMNSVIASNPDGIADVLNTKQNSLTFLNMVAAELQNDGFYATTNVLNGNNNPNSGDAIAIWKSGDTTIERYDAVMGTSAPSQMIRQSVTSGNFTGDIPLGCANNGGSKNCADPNFNPNSDSNTNNGSGDNTSGAEAPFKPQVLFPPPPATDFNQLIGNTFRYALSIVGIAVFIMIMWGGFLWVTSTANPGNIATAKRKIYNAIIGAIFLLSIYVILNTINPELVGGVLRLPGIQAPVVNQPPTAICSNGSALAQQFNNAAFPRRVAAELATLMVCLESDPTVSSLIDKNQTYTFEISNDMCNYTRGNTLCGTCAHSLNSCHYGGAAGRDGSLAVDYNTKDGSPTGEQQLFNALNSLKSTCGFGYILFEQTHTHLSTTSCSGN